MLGPQDFLTLDSMHGLAQAIQRQGRHSEAEPLYRHLIELRVKSLGRKSPDTLDSMRGLAETLVGPKKYLEAKQLGEQVLRLGKDFLGRQRHDPLCVMNVLAQAYFGLGMQDKGAEMVLQFCKRRDEQEKKKSRP